MFCEGSQKYEVLLTSVSSDKALAEVLRAHPVPPLKKPYLKLALSLPRLSKFESLLETAVQMGVKEIQPFLSDFSFFKKTSQLKPDRWRRWEKIVQQSKALSARTEDLKIHPLCFLSEFSISKQDKVLIAYENSKDSIKTCLKESSSDIWLFIGSEGGFSVRELEFFQKANPQALCFSLGHQILKVETACLFALSLLKYHYHL